MTETFPEMIAPARAALLVVDAQADFASADGAMAGAGADLTAVPAALANVAVLVDAARAAGATLAFARVVTRPGEDPPALVLLNARRGGAPADIALCREGEPGCDYVGVRPAPGEIEVAKRLYDSFHETDLEAQLRARGADTLVVAGFSTHCCIDATCRSAFHRGFNVFVVGDATDAYDAELQRATLRALAATCALVVSADDVRTVWRR